MVAEYTNFVKFCYKMILHLQEQRNKTVSKDTEKVNMSTACAMSQQVVAEYTNLELMAARSDKTSGSLFLFLPPDSGK